MNIDKLLVWENLTNKMYVVFVLLRIKVLDYINNAILVISHYIQVSKEE
jgi:hypothetical protein